MYQMYKYSQCNEKIPLSVFINSEAGSFEVDKCHGKKILMMKGLNELIYKHYM